MVAIFTDNIFKRIFMNEKCCISIQISLRFVLNGPFDNKLALVQVTGDKPLPEPMLTQFPDTCMWHSREMSKNNTGIMVIPNFMNTRWDILAHIYSLKGNIPKTCNSLIPLVLTVCRINLVSEIKVYLFKHLKDSKQSVCIFK